MLAGQICNLLVCQDIGLGSSNCISWHRGLLSNYKRMKHFTVKEGWGKEYIWTLAVLCQSFSLSAFILGPDIFKMMYPFSVLFWHKRQKQNLINLNREMTHDWLSKQTTHVSYIVLFVYNWHWKCYVVVNCYSQ